MQIALDLKKASSVGAFITDYKSRRIGQLYFQQLPDGGIVPRMITRETDSKWLKKMIAAGKIYVTPDKIICETK